MQNVKSKHELFEEKGNSLRFRNERLSSELIEDIIMISREFLGSRKELIITNIRATIVNEQIKGQLDYLTTSITAKLKNEQRTLVSRLEHEASSVEVSAQQVSLSTFLQKATGKEVDEYEEDNGCWGRTKVISPMTSQCLR